ncbi:MAG: endonuclease/exonuclease/phosphatase family protein [Clostridia bacterium]|nr:endonuclease/exonuclease/phosphatase family protein [Clostridia bacterium]
MSAKRIISLFLGILMLFGAFGLTACTGDGDTEDTGGAESDSLIETDPPVERTALIENGKAVYTVVYPNDASSAVLTAMNVFIEGVKKATGVTLPSKSDNLRPGQVRDENAKEILFGKTNYDETQEILSGLYDDEYVIKSVGSKIVIVSSNESYLRAAANYYVKNLVKKNLEGEEGAYTLFFEEYHFLAEGADKVTNINGRTIQNFCIVYETERDGYEAIANRLCEAIVTYTGYRLPVYADTDRKAGDCEILVGQTNRALSEKSYKDFVDLLTYKVVIEGDAVQIVAGGPFSARSCVDAMGVIFFAGGGKQFLDGTYVETDMKGEASEASTETDLRVMTSNMLTSWWGEQADASIPPVVQRAEIAAAMLTLYKPDVIGMQEVDGVWGDAFADYFKILKDEYGVEYSALHDRYEGKVNLTCILYRSDKLTVKESGVEVSSYWSSSYHMRNITWAVFSDGKNEFMLANNHWAHESNDWKQKSSDQLVDFIKNTDFDSPIFCTGDFNAKPTLTEAEISEGVYHAFENFVNKTEPRWLKEEAKSLGVLVKETGGCHAVGTAASGGNYIDHIFGFGEFTIVKYDTVTGSSSHWMSDHSPHYCDVKF